MIELRGIHYQSREELAALLRCTPDTITCRANRHGVKPLRLGHKAYYTDDDVDRIITGERNPKSESCESRTSKKMLQNIKTTEGAGYHG